MKFTKWLKLEKPDTEKKITYTSDFTGPCGKRIDRCERYMEYVTRPKTNYKSACEACEENLQLD